MRRPSTIALVLVFSLGVALILYPSFSDWWNRRRQSTVITGYDSSVQAMDAAARRALRDEAHAYNDGIARRGVEPTPLDGDSARYKEMLDVAGTGIMGYLEIPAIGQRLPIHHGTDESVLQRAVGHLAGSSLPVGGASTHCVLSSHRGLPGARLFTDLDQLEAGDRFAIHVLGETLTYEVDQMRVVLPTDLSPLQIEEGRDLCTLVTCTPYGINTHRLLVRGHRVEGARGGMDGPDAAQADPAVIAPPVAATLLVLLLVWMLLGTRGAADDRRSRDPRHAGATHG